MTRLRTFLATLLVTLPAVACDGRADSVVGRWEYTRQPREWVQFDPNGTFMARSFTEPDTIRGTYKQDGSTVTITNARNHTTTLTLRDSVLVMEDGAGTEYRRVSTPP